MVSIIGALSRPSKAAAPVAGATAGTGLPSRAHPTLRARARFTTRSAPALGTSAKCSNNRATDRYPKRSITPRDSISTSRAPISASADRTTPSSEPTRSAKATASARQAKSLSTNQDYPHTNTCSSHERMIPAGKPLRGESALPTTPRSAHKERRFPTPRRSRILKEGNQTATKP